MKLTLSEDAPPLPVAKYEVIGGKYRVDRVVAHGGMGIICTGEHIELEQRVAIKFIRPELLASSELVDGFLREARAAAMLSGPHAVKVMDIGKLSTGMPYMVMEFLEGEDLQSRLERGGAVPERDAVRYAIQLCEALAEAHAVGVVHRDIKPENLFISASPGRRATLKVLDFGIALRRCARTAEGDRSPDVVGSPWYMSPEQISTPTAVDARADIWSVGVVLFEMISGRLPFEGSEVEEVCRRVLEDAPPPLDEIAVGVDPVLAGIVTRCLEKDPAARYGSVTQVAEALEACWLASTRAPDSLPPSEHRTAPGKPSSARPVGGSEANGVPSSTPPPVATSVEPPARAPNQRRALSLRDASLAAAAILLAGWGVAALRDAPVNTVNKAAARWLSPVELGEGPRLEVVEPRPAQPDLVLRNVSGATAAAGNTLRAEPERVGDAALREATRRWRERTADSRRQAYADFLREQGWTPIREVLADLRVPPDTQAGSAAASSPPVEPQVAASPAAGRRR